MSIKEQASSQNLKSLTQKIKNIGATILFGLEDTPFKYKECMYHAVHQNKKACDKKDCVTVQCAF